VQLDPEPFSQCAHGGLRGAVNSPAGRKHFDPENGSEVDDMTTLLLQHLRQHGCDPIQNSFEIDIDLAVPFVHLERLDWCDGHNTGVIHHDIDTPEIVDSCPDECFHFSALCHVDSDIDGLTTCGGNFFHGCVEPVLTPRS
jgi:hypothetical protein